MKILKKFDADHLDVKNEFIVQSTQGKRFQWNRTVLLENPTDKKIAAVSLNLFERILYYFHCKLFGVNYEKFNRVFSSTNVKIVMASSIKFPIAKSNPVPKTNALIEEEKKQPVGIVSNAQSDFIYVRQDRWELHQHESELYKKYTQLLKEENLEGIQEIYSNICHSHWFSFIDFMCLCVKKKNYKLFFEKQITRNMFNVDGCVEQCNKLLQRLVYEGDVENAQKAFEDFLIESKDFPRIQVQVKEFFDDLMVNKGKKVGWWDLKF